MFEVLVAEVILPVLKNAVSPVVAGLIAYRPGVGFLYAPRLRQDVVEAQLQKLYTPAMKVILASNMSCSIKLIKIKQLCDQNLELCIPALVDAIIEWEISHDVINSYNEVEKIVRANWNWAKRALRYPYKENEINDDCVYGYFEHTKKVADLEGFGRKCSIAFWILFAATIAFAFASGYYSFANEEWCKNVIDFLSVVLFVCEVPTVFYYMFRTTAKGH